MTDAQRAGDFFHGAWMQEFRQQMRDHAPPEGCKDCLSSAQLGTYSQRDDGWDVYRNMLANAQFTDQPRLQYMELNFSNICNLKCRMCGNDRSSKWTADSEAMGFPVQGKVVNDVVITDSMLSDLRYIKLLGGEPLLHAEQLTDILGRAAELGTLAELSLGITTNGTIRPAQRLLELLAKCHHVIWTVSVDAQGELNDYIRTGSSWAEVSANLLWLYDLCTVHRGWNLGIGSVCMIHNANRMEELAGWVDTNLPNRIDSHHWYPCNFPEYLSVTRLPAHYLASLASKYQSLADAETNTWRRDRWWLPLAELMRSSQDQAAYINRHHSWSAFSAPSLPLISRLDALRGDSLAAVNPEIYEQLRGANQ